MAPATIARVFPSYTPAPQKIVPSVTTPPTPLGRHLRRDAARILAETLRAIDPATLVANALADHLELVGWAPELARREGPGRTVLVAVGKGALRMTRGALSLLEGRVDEGIVLVPHGVVQTRPEWLPRHLRLREGGHPLPDADGAEATREIERLVDSLVPEDRLLVLLSGGGSALLTAPEHGIDFSDLIEMQRVLLGSGLRIDELNLVRRATERLKGGGLARAARVADILGLVLSDVPGDDPAVVASGPLSPSPTSIRDAEILLRRKGVWLELPEGVRRWMEVRREVVGSDLPAPDRLRIAVIGSGDDAADAARTAARRCGYTPSLLTRELRGEARRAGRGLARAGLAVRDGTVRMPRPTCLIATGETTVRVVGGGRGGRNQEVALGAAQFLRGRDGVLVTSIGTDGIDGPTDAAGGWADGESWARAEAAGLSIDDALADNDAYPLLAALDDLVLTGPTGTNVADLALVLVAEEQAEDDRAEVTANDAES